MRSDFGRIRDNDEYYNYNDDDNSLGKRRTKKKKLAHQGEEQVRRDFRTMINKKSEKLPLWMKNTSLLSSTIVQKSQKERENKMKIVWVQTNFDEEVQFRKKKTLSGERARRVGW